MLISILVLAACIAVCVLAYRDGINEQDKAGKFGLLFSALFPIVGIIIYFVQRTKVIDPTKYAKWAGIGFLVGLVGNLLLGLVNYV